MMAFVLLGVIYFFVAVQPAQAYLDPGTGSYITQLAIGFLIGGGYLIKTYWQKIWTFFTSLRQHRHKNEDKKSV